MLTFEIRPWGKWEEYINETGYRVKRIIIDPHKRFSLQKHHFRSEVWTIVAGSGLVTIDDSIHRVNVGEVIEIPTEVIHRLENDQLEPLVLIEVQLGICDENDIVRIEDDWNRIT